MFESRSFFFFEGLKCPGKQSECRGSWKKHGVKPPCFFFQLPRHRSISNMPDRMQVVCVVYIPSGQLLI